MDSPAITPIGRSPDPRTVLGRVPEIIFGKKPLSATVPPITELAKQTITGVVDASVTLVVDDDVSTISGASSLAAYLDQRQYDAGGGPCVDAARSGATITIDDTCHSVAYPTFGPVAHRHGITHTMSVGLTVARQVGVALNLYGGDGSTFDASTAELATEFVSWLAVAVTAGGPHASTRAEFPMMDGPRWRPGGSWLHRLGCDLRADSQNILRAVAAVEDSVAVVMEGLALGSDARGHQADAERRRQLADQARAGAARARLLSLRGAAR